MAVPLRSDERADTKTAILDIAERLVQKRGFNGFSYADVAGELGITKAALHYHFAGKSELGEALLERYASRFLEALAVIEKAEGSALDRLGAYTRLYLGVLKDERMCLCGMLAAEYDTLPQPMRRTVMEFFEANQSWLKSLLETGRNEGSLRVADGDAGRAAQMVLSALEGAMLVARPFGDTRMFEAVAQQLLGELKAV